MAEDTKKALALELLEVQRTLGWMDLVIGHITDAVYVVDANKRLVFVNEYFSKLVDIPRVFLLGQLVDDIFKYAEKLDASDQYMTTPEADDESPGNTTGIFERERDGVRKIYNISSRYISTINQTVYIAKDITSEYEMSVMKNNFINIASHQLRTPMTAIMTYSHMLYEGYGGELAKDQKNLAERLVISSERMISLVNDILLISRLQNGDEKLLERDGTLSEVFSSLEEELKPKLELKSLSFIKHYQEEVRQVKCNKFLLHEILSNILTNSIQYTPDGGKISINANLVNKIVKVVITDNGIGIPQEYLPKIYEQFTRADNAFKVFNEGTGLGLYVVKVISDLLKGQIECKSKVNEGATFTLTYPVKN